MRKEEVQCADAASRKAREAILIFDVVDFEGRKVAGGAAGRFAMVSESAARAAGAATPLGSDVWSGSFLPTRSGKGGAGGVREHLAGGSAAAPALQVPDDQSLETQLGFAVTEPQGRCRDCLRGGETAYSGTQVFQEVSSVLSAGFRRTKPL